MARNLTSIPDIQAPDADYPVGRIQNEETTPTPITGTPIIEELYGDIVQFFHKLIRLAGITHNGLPENETNGFQFITSLTAFVRTVLASTTARGSVELADNAETQAGLDSQRAVTPAGLESKTATSTRKGIIELATGTEVAAGTDSERAITPATLLSRTATDGRAGVVELATLLEVLAGTDTVRAITPALLNAKDGGLITTVIPINAWNMDSTPFVNISIGSISQLSIRRITVLIRNDDITTLTDLNTFLYGYYQLGAFSLSTITLYRTDSGMFDSVDYDYVGINRGYVIIDHVNS